MQLTSGEILLLSIVAVAVVLILSNRVRADLVGILVLLTLSLTGLVTPDEALSGFSRSAVITIIALFILTEGLEQTGVIQWSANRIRQLGGGSEVRLIVIFMATGALLSLVMNNIAAAAVLLPAAVSTARDANVRTSKLLIPLAFGTSVGGMATLLTTANIIMSGILQERGFGGLSFSDFLPTGGLIVLASLVYMLLIGRRLLPSHETAGGTSSPRVLARALRETYALDERLWEIRVPPTAWMVGTPLSQCRIGEALGVTVVAIWRNHHAILTPALDEIIQANDYLLVLGREDRVGQLESWGLVLGRENGAVRQRDYSVDLTEVIIPPRSNIVGKTLKELHFRNKYGLTSVALWREGRSYRTDVGLFPLHVGDALLMVGPASKIRALSRERDFMVLASSHASQPPLPDKATWAVAITALVLLASILEIIPIAEAMLAGAAAMVLTGCISMDEAYRAVEWRVVFLIAGMLPVSIAMNSTGLAANLSGAFIDLVAPYGGLVLIAGMWLLAMLVSQVISGQVAGLVIGPVAVTAALQGGVSPHAMAVAVAIGCSTAFLLPTSHAVNLIMMGPGGYQSGDFLRVGLGMTVLTGVVLVIGLILFWGIR